MTVWLSISDIVHCLMGVKQGCLFGLFVVCLQQHLMDTLRHDAPFLSGAPILQQLLVYVDDIVVTLTIPAGYSNSFTHCNIPATKDSIGSAKVVTFKIRMETFSLQVNVQRQQDGVCSFIQVPWIKFQAMKSLVHGSPAAPFCQQSKVMHSRRFSLASEACV
ncbi:hypothetical protein ABBQ38_014716 [Trebouxia sp. C0009 RCD-2024]